LVLVEQKNARGENGREETKWESPKWTPGSGARFKVASFRGLSVGVTCVTLKNNPLREIIPNVFIRHRPQRCLWKRLTSGASSELM
jgi:hypothetical protein